MKITHYPIALVWICCGFALIPPAVRAAEPTADQKFAKKAAAGGMFEVKLGEVAIKNAAAADVKAFGTMMVADHGKAGDELKGIADKQDIKLPAALPEKLQAKMDKLSKLEGKEFDTAYVSEMVRDHEKDLAGFKEEAESGKDPELKAFATNTATMVEAHLKAAQKIQAGMK
jgi:putative membrane protein